MTDADVDGSHIRTLILTFFHKHMKDIIKEGHLYVAQPPLFKVKRGKSEVYLKDEIDLENFLIDSSINDLILYYGKDKIKLSGDHLLKAITKITQYAKILRYISKDLNIYLLNLNSGFSLEDFNDVDKVTKIIDNTIKHLNKNLVDEIWEGVFIKAKREIIFTHTKNEIIKKYKISEAFLNKSEVKKLNNDNTDTIGIFFDGAYLE